MVVELNERAVLEAYSEGKIGWREACRELPFVDVGELKAALLEQGLPEPDYSEPLDENTLFRFDQFLTGGGQ